jgi:hypothetical protein
MNFLIVLFGNSLVWATAGAIAQQEIPKAVAARASV